MYQDPNLPPWVTQQDVEWTPYMDFCERLEYLDNNNWDKEQYMKLIKDIIYDYWISALDTATIENAIYSYADAR